MAAVELPGNDGKLVIDNLPINKIDAAVDKANEMIAAGAANTEVLSKVSKYQTYPESVALDTKTVVNRLVADRNPTKTVKTKAAKTVTVKAKAKTEKVAKTAKTKGDGNAKRVRALEMFKDMTASGFSQEKMLKAVMDELKITYANTYYYYSRVFKKG
jgi:hypothetical protein